MNLQENIQRIKEMMGVIVENYYDIKKLYVDMGGVLFEKMSADEGGSGNKTEFIGSNLWNNIKNYNPIILTATGVENSENSKKIKIQQVKNNLEPTPKIEFVLRKTDKKKFATTTQDDSVYPNILIDDSEINIKEWTDNGGIGILHRNDQTTLEELKKYII